MRNTDLWQFELSSLGVNQNATNPNKVRGRGLEVFNITFLYLLSNFQIWPSTVRTISSFQQKKRVMNPCPKWLLSLFRKPRKKMMTVFSQLRELLGKWEIWFEKFDVETKNPNDNLKRNLRIKQIIHLILPYYHYPKYFKLSKNYN